MEVRKSAGTRPQPAESTQRKVLLARMLASFAWKTQRLTPSGYLSIIREREPRLSEDCHKELVQDETALSKMDDLQFLVLIIQKHAQFYYLCMCAY